MQSRVVRSREGGVSRVRTLIARGKARLDDGRYGDAAKLLTTAISRMGRRRTPRDLDLVVPLNLLGICFRHLGRFNEAGPLHQRALALLEDHGRAQSQAAADTHSQLAGLEYAAGNWLRGEPFAREALRIRARLLGHTHPAVAADRIALAALLERQGRRREAERMYRHALPTLEAAYGSDDHRVAVALNNLAAAYHARGAVRDAEAMYRRAQAIEMSLGGADHPNLAYTMNNLAVVLMMTRRSAAAAALLRRAVTLVTRRLGPHHPHVAHCLENYGEALRRLRRTTAAQRAATRAARILARVDAVNDDAVAVTASINPAFARYRLSVRPSSIHRIGVFAEERIPPGRKVIEYTGERITQREAERRWNPSRSYLFDLNDRWQLDGAIGGSGAEYINHSCEPNLRTRILKDHILYFSDRPIARGEELTVDYHYEAELDPIPCGCGAAACRGTMNVLPED